MAALCMCGGCGQLRGPVVVAWERDSEDPGSILGYAILSLVPLVVLISVSKLTMSVYISRKSLIHWHPNGS